MGTPTTEGRTGLRTKGLVAAAQSPPLCALLSWEPGTELGSYILLLHLILTPALHNRYSYLPFAAESFEA